MNEKKTKTRILTSTIIRVTFFTLPSYIILLLAFHILTDDPFALDHYTIFTHIGIDPKILTHPAITLPIFTIFILTSISAAIISVIYDDFLIKYSLITGIYIVSILLFSFIYAYYGYSDGEEIRHNLKESLFLSIITWTTVGYGNIYPVNGSIIASAIQALIAPFFYAFATAVIVADVFERRQSAMKRQKTTKQSLDHENS